MINVQRAFGCGIDHRIFKDKYEGLSETDKEGLERVARRINLTLALRYRVSIRRNPLERYSREVFDFEYFELPSTEVYLLCTCLDTLAGKVVYKDFQKWLKTQWKGKSLSLEEVLNLHTRYLEQHGHRRNLKKLFRNLPKSAKLWLSDNVKIRRSDDYSRTLDQDIDKLINQLFVYFFDIKRNAFTHGSETRLTVQADNIQAPKDNNLWVTPAQGIFTKDNKEFNFLYRHGLDEATILRIIILAVALQFLNIELTPELIAANLQKHSRLDALYAFIAEVKANSVTINILSKLSENKQAIFNSSLLRHKVPPLESEASISIVDMYLDNPLESGLKQMTTQYLNYISQLNSIISDFNNSNPPPNDNDHQIERLQVVKAFLEEQIQKPLFGEILKWPTITPMTNLWIVIRDPCYTGRIHLA